MAGLRLAAVAAVVASGLVLTGPGDAVAQSREVTALMNRVQQLEQQVRALEGRGGFGGAAAARLDVRQSQQEEDLRALTGRVEEWGYRVDQLDRRLEKLVADIEYRLGQGAQIGDAPPAAPPAAGAAADMPPPGPAPAPGPAATSGPAPAPAEGPAGAEMYPERQPRPLGTMPAEEAGAPPAARSGGEAAVTGAVAGSPRQRYAQAYDLLRQGKYDKAEAAFSAFLAQHPDDPLAGNARYWLGETFYARGDYARATEGFVEGYQTNKAGPKAPDTLLKLGMSLSAMGKGKEACATFRELSRAFPNAPAAVKEKAAQEGRRAGCS